MSQERSTQQDRSLYARATQAIKRIAGFSGLGPVLARLVLGVLLIRSGCVVFESLQGISEAVRSFDLPAPDLLAALIGSTELVCGLLLMVGFLCRLAATCMAVGFVLALAIVKADPSQSLLDALTFRELVRILLLAWIAVAGAGPISVDGWVAKGSRLAKP